MALISCPECGKEISDKAPAFIHCGYPMDAVNSLNYVNANFLNDKNEIIINYNKIDKKELLQIMEKTGYSKIQSISLLKEQTGLSLTECKELFNPLYEEYNKSIDKKYSVTKLPESQRKCNNCNSIFVSNAHTCPSCKSSNTSFFQSVQTASPKSIKCPTCSSTNITKISGANKAGSVALFGIFSMGHISKTFKCNNCGYKW